MILDLAFPPEECDEEIGQAYERKGDLGVHEIRVARGEFRPAEPSFFGYGAMIQALAQAT